MFTVTSHNVYRGIPFFKPRYTTFLPRHPPRPALKFPRKTCFPLCATTTNYAGEWSTYVNVYHIFSHRIPWYTVLKNSVYHIYDPILNRGNPKFTAQCHVVTVAVTCSKRGAYLLLTPSCAIANHSSTVQWVPSFTISAVQSTLHPHARPLLCPTV